MGLSAVAGHLIVFVALVSAGTAFVAATGDALSDGVTAQSEATHRLLAAANTRILFNGSTYDAATDAVTATWLNNGSEEVTLDGVTLLVDGVVTPHASVAAFRVVESPTSEVWLPGETLEVEVRDQGNVDLTVVGPYGHASHRRP